MSQAPEDLYAAIARGETPSRAAAPPPPPTRTPEDIYAAVARGEQPSAPAVSPLGDLHAEIEATAKRHGLRQSSGYRTPEHNRRVGGVPNSAHTHQDEQGRSLGTDWAGTPRAMRAFYDEIKRQYGNQIDQIIYGTADHLDHVHVARPRIPRATAVQAATPKPAAAPDPRRQVRALDQKIAALRTKSADYDRRIQELLSPPVGKRAVPNTDPLVQKLLHEIRGNDAEYAAARQQGQRWHPGSLNERVETLLAQRAALLGQQPAKPAPRTVNLAGIDFPVPQALEGATGAYEALRQLPGAGPIARLTEPLTREALRHTPVGPKLAELEKASRAQQAQAAGEVERARFIDALDARRQTALDKAAFIKDPRQRAQAEAAAVRPSFRGFTFSVDAPAPAFALVAEELTRRGTPAEARFTKDGKPLGIWIGGKQALKPTERPKLKTAADLPAVAADLGQRGIEALIGTFTPFTQAGARADEAAIKAANDRMLAAGVKLPRPGTKTFTDAVKPGKDGKPGPLTAAGTHFEQWFRRDMRERPRGMSAQEEIRSIVNSAPYQQAFARLPQGAQEYVRQMVLAELVMGQSDTSQSSKTGAIAGALVDAALWKGLQAPAAVAERAGLAAGRNLVGREAAEAALARGNVSTAREAGLGAVPREAAVRGLRQAPVGGLYTGAFEAAGAVADGKLADADDRFVQGATAGAFGSFVAGALLPKLAAAPRGRQAAQEVLNESVEEGTQEVAQAIGRGERDPRKLAEIYFGAALLGGIASSGRAGLDLVGGRDSAQSRPAVSPLRRAQVEQAIGQSLLEAKQAEAPAPTPAGLAPGQQVVVLRKDGTPGRETTVARVEPDGRVRLSGVAQPVPAERVQAVPTGAEPVVSEMETAPAPVGQPAVPPLESQRVAGLQRFGQDPDLFAQPEPAPAPEVAPAPVEAMAVPEPVAEQVAPVAKPARTKKQPTPIVEPPAVTAASQAPRTPAARAKVPYAPVPKGTPERSAIIKDHPTLLDDHIKALEAKYPRTSGGPNPFPDRATAEDFFKTVDAFQAAVNKRFSNKQTGAQWVDQAFRDGYTLQNVKRGAVTRPVLKRADGMQMAVPAELLPYAKLVAEYAQPSGDAGPAPTVEAPAATSSFSPLKTGQAAPTTSISDEVLASLTHEETDTYYQTGFLPRRLVEAKPTTPKSTSAKPAPATPRSVTLEVDGRSQSATLTPDQAAEWDRAEANYKTARARLQDDLARAKASKTTGPVSPTAEVDGRLARIDALGKQLRALAMQHAAEKRRIAGLLTAKEQGAAKKASEVIGPGKRVTVTLPDGQERGGVVVGRPFGKVKVKFDNGHEATHPADKVKLATPEATATTAAVRASTETENIPNARVPEPQSRRDRGGERARVAAEESAATEQSSSQDHRSSEGGGEATGPAISVTPRGGVRIDGKRVASARLAADAFSILESAESDFGDLGELIAGLGGDRYLAAINFIGVLEGQDLTQEFVQAHSDWQHISEARYQQQELAAAERAERETRQQPQQRLADVLSALSARQSVPYTDAAGEKRTASYFEFDTNAVPEADREAMYQHIIRTSPALQGRTWRIPAFGRGNASLRDLLVDGGIVPTEVGNRYLLAGTLTGFQSSVMTRLRGKGQTLAELKADYAAEGVSEQRVERTLGELERLGHVFRDGDRYRSGNLPKAKKPKKGSTPPPETNELFQADNQPTLAGIDEESKASLEQDLLNNLRGRGLTQAQLVTRLQTQGHANLNAAAKLILQLQRDGRVFVEGSGKNAVYRAGQAPRGGQAENLYLAGEREGKGQQAQGKLDLLDEAEQNTLFQLDKDPSLKGERVTDTPAFRKWFGKSRVVDERGQPLVVYHGTPNGKFVEFDSGRMGETDYGFYGQGFYLSAVKSYAEMYQRRSGKRTKPFLIEGYVSLQNPLDLDNASDADWDKLFDAVNEVRAERGREPLDANEWADERAQFIGAKGSLVSSLAKDRAVLISTLGDSDLIRRAGYDGVLANDKQEIVAFSPTQIKSVHNQGTFNPRNPNILKQQDPAVQKTEPTPATKQRPLSASARGHLAEVGAIDFARGNTQFIDWAPNLLNTVTEWFGPEVAARVRADLPALWTAAREHYGTQEFRDLAATEVPTLPSVTDEDARLIEAVRGGASIVRNQGELETALQEHFGYDAEQTAHTGAVAEAHARWWADVTGRTVGEFYRTRLAAIGSGRAEEARVESELQQQPQASGAVVRGSTVFLRDTRALITALTDPNASTALHELDHAFTPELVRTAAESGDAEMQADAEAFAKWAGFEDTADFLSLHEKWVADTLSGKDRERYVAGMEKFARGKEAYLREGKAPTPELKRVFERFRAWLKEIYRTLRGSEIDVKLTPAARKFMARTLGADFETLEKLNATSSTTAGAEGAARATAERARDGDGRATSENADRSREVDQPAVSVPLTTGLANQVQVRKVLEGTLERLPEKGRPRSVRELQARGEELLKAGRRDPIALAREIALGERGITADDFALFLAQTARMEQRVNATRAELRSAIGQDSPARIDALQKTAAEAEQALQTFLDDAQKAKGEWHNIGMALQAGVELDTGNFAQVLERAHEAKGQPLTEREREKLLAPLVDQIEKQDAAIKKLERQNAALRAARASVRRRREGGLRPAAIKLEREALLRDLDELTTNLLKQRAAARPTPPRGVGDAGGAEGAVLYQVTGRAYDAERFQQIAGRLAVNYLRSGAPSLEDVVSLVTADLSARGVSITPDQIIDDLDALSRRGPVTKTDLQTQIAALRRAARSDAAARQQIRELIRQLQSGDYTLPTRREITVASRLANLRAHRDLLHREVKARISRFKPTTTLEKVANTVGLVRTLRTSFDISAPGRQGWLLTLAHPASGAKAFGAQIRSLTSPVVANRLQAELLTRPNTALYKRGGLYLSTAEIGEEAFNSSLLAKWQRLNPYKASERAYTAYLNRLRADTFDQLVKMLGPNPSDGDLRLIANYVNVASGRGGASLGPKFQQAASGLAEALFSPRYLASRFEYLLAQPVLSTVPGGAKARALVVTEYARTLGALAAFIGLAVFFGAEWNDDEPTSPDFLKLKFGDTRIDLFAGLQQPIRFVAKVQGSSKLLGGSGKGQPTSDALQRFARSKAAPVPGTLWSLVEGKDFLGNPYHLRHAAADLTIPMTMQELVNAAAEDGWDRQDYVSLLGLLGFGVQRYAPGEEKKERPF